jgi:hypothetical protein
MAPLELEGDQQCARARGASWLHEQYPKCQGFEKNHGIRKERYFSLSIR